MKIDSLVTTRRYFAASDGVELSYSLWSRSPEAEHQSIVLILHGIGFHSAPYVKVVESLDVPGALFAGLDFRGHGYSGGVRGELPVLERMLQDIEEWVGHLRLEHPHARTFMLAESMAGPYATLYSARNPGSLQGLVLVAPAVLAHWRQVLDPDTFRCAAQVLMNPEAQSIELKGSRLGNGVKPGVEIVSQRAADPLSIKSVTPGYIKSIALTIASLVAQKSLCVNAPVLIVQGAKDNIISPLGARLLMMRLKSPDKRLVTVPEAYHTLIWDSSAPQVHGIIGNWLVERLGLDFPNDRVLAAD